MINLLLQVFIIAMLLPITLYHTQDSSSVVTVQPETIFQREDLPVVFVCKYSSSAFTFGKLVWNHNGVEIKAYHGNVGKNDTVENNYEFSINKTYSVLRLRAVNPARDLGNYTCLVQFRNKSSGFFFWKNATGLLTVQVPTNSLFHFSDDGKKDFLENGEIVKVYQGNPHIFFFEVIGIMPKVTIECYLGEERLETSEPMTGVENEKRITVVYFAITTEHIEQGSGSQSTQLACNASTTLSDWKDPLPSVHVTVSAVSAVSASTSWLPWVKWGTSVTLGLLAYTLGLLVVFLVLKHKVKLGRQVSGEQVKESELMII